MKGFVKKIAGGLAVFGLLAGGALAVSAVGGSIVYADASEESIMGLDDSEKVIVKYKENRDFCDCSCDSKKPITETMTKAQYKELKKDEKVKEIIEVKPAEAAGAEGDVATEGMAVSDEAAETAKDEPVATTPTELQITSAEWLGGEGDEALFSVSGFVPAGLAVDGYLPEEFYLGVGAAPTIDNWAGIQTAQDGVDMKTTENADGSLNVEWSNTFYCPETELNSNDEWYVSFSVHDPEYTEEILSPAVRVEKKMR